MGGERPASRLAASWLPVALAAFTLNQAAINMIRPMVSYRALGLGMDTATLGLLAAAFSVAPLFVALQLGRLIDRRGELPFIVIGSLLLVMGSVGLVLVDRPEQAPFLFLLFAVIGLGENTAGVATQAMIARGSEEHTYDRGFAAFSFYASIGQLAGPAIAAVVAGQGTHEEVTRALAVAAVIATLVLPAILLIRPPASVKHPSRTASGGGGPAGSRPGILQIVRLPGLLMGAIAGTAVLAAIDILITYMPALGEANGWSASLVGTLLAIRAGSSMVVRLGLGRLAARFGRRSLIIGSMAVSAASMLLLPVVAAVPVVALLMVTSGLGLGIGQPLSMAMVASAAPPEVRATALSVRILGNGIGRIMLPVVAGTMAAVAGAGGVLAVTGGALAASVAGFMADRHAGRPPRR